MVWRDQINLQNHYHHHHQQPDSTYTSDPRYQRYGLGELSTSICFRSTDWLELETLTILHSILYWLVSGIHSCRIQNISSFCYHWMKLVWMIYFLLYLCSVWKMHRMSKFVSMTILMLIVLFVLLLHLIKF